MTVALAPSGLMEFNVLATMSHGTMVMVRVGAARGAVPNGRGQSVAEERCWMCIASERWEARG